MVADVPSPGWPMVPLAIDAAQFIIFATRDTFNRQGLAVKPGAATSLAYPCGAVVRFPVERTAIATRERETTSHGQPASV